MAVDAARIVVIVDVADAHGAAGEETASDDIAKGAASLKLKHDFLLFIVFKCIINGFQVIKVWFIQRESSKLLS